MDGESPNILILGNMLLKGIKICFNFNFIKMGITLYAEINYYI